MSDLESEINVINLNIQGLILAKNKIATQIEVLKLHRACLKNVMLQQELQQKQQELEELKRYGNT